MLNEYGGVESTLTLSNRNLARYSAVRKWKLFLFAFFLAITVLGKYWNYRKSAYSANAPFMNMIHVATFLIFVYLPAVQSLPLNANREENLRFVALYI